MNEQIDHFQKRTKDQLHQVSASTESFANGMKSVMDETANYSQRSMQNTAEFFQKLTGERSFENAIRLQAEFARTQYEDFMNQFRKIGEIYQNMSREALKPAKAALDNSKDALRH